MIQAWLMQHWHAFILVLKRFVSTPFASLLSIIVIGITFSLPAGFYMLLTNIQAYSERYIEIPQFSLLFKQDAGAQDVEEIRQRLEQHPQVTGVQFVSKTLALQQLVNTNDFPDAIGNLEQNPLPDAFVITLQNVAAEELGRISAVMQHWPAIEHVQFDTAWAMRLEALLKFGQFAVILIAMLFCLAVVAVTFYVIRMNILAKRDEIEVSRLIGATDSFIRRPFLYFGVVQGLAGGLISWLIITLGIHVINDELSVLSRLYSVDLYLKNFATIDLMSLLIFSSWLGWLGARLSVAGYFWHNDL